MSLSARQIKDALTLRLTPLVQGAWNFLDSLLLHADEQGRVTEEAWDKIQDEVGVRHQLIGLAIFAESALIEGANPPYRWRLTDRAFSTAGLPVPARGEEVSAAEGTIRSQLEEDIAAAQVPGDPDAEEEVVAKLFGPPS